MSFNELVDVADQLCPVSRLSYLIDDPDIKFPCTPAPPTSPTPPAKELKQATFILSFPSKWRKQQELEAASQARQLLVNSPRPNGQVRLQQHTRDDSMLARIVSSSRIELSLHTNVDWSDGRTQNKGTCDTSFKSKVPKTRKIQTPTLPNSTQMCSIPNVLKMTEMEQLTVTNPAQSCSVPNLYVSSAVEIYTV